MEMTQDSEIQNGEVKEEFKASSDGSLCGYDSLHRLLKENFKPQHFQVFSFLRLSTFIIYLGFLFCDSVFVFIYEPILNLK